MIRAHDPKNYLFRSLEYLPGGSLGGAALPLELRFTVARGRAGYIESVEGQRYLDFVCGSGANILAHDHPEIVEAICRRVKDGVHFFGVLNDAAVDFAEELIAAIPCAERIIYTTTGSEATSYAMRIARAVTGKQIILKFEGAYHGNQDSANFSQFPVRPANYPHAAHDYYGVPDALSDSLMVVPFNDLEAVESVLRASAAQIAAIIVEPLQRILSPRPGFLQGLRKLADDYGLLLIFDEVVTGFRLALGGGQEYYGVTPDLACFGKIIGGGLPLGCVAGPADLIDFTDPKRRGSPGYAYTTGNMHGDPLGCVAGLATLKVLREPGFYEALHAKSDAFRVQCQKVLNKHSLPAMVVGEGSLWQILFVDFPPSSQTEIMASDLERTGDIDIGLLRKGIFVMPKARRFVSAAHTDEDLSFAVGALEEVCESLEP